MHGVFEDNLRLAAILDPKYEVERSIFDKINDRVIAGRFDILYDGKDLWDIKTCATWKTIFDPDMVEWHEQLNMYAYLLARRGVEIETINILAVYKDWRKMMALRDRNYPQEQVIAYQLDLWDYEVTEDYVRKRIDLMIENEMVDDVFLPFCTSEDMWEKPTKYACMKDKRVQRASRVFDSREEAESYMQTSKTMAGDSAFIEVRKGERTRCKDYCEVAEYCNQYQEFNNA
jgi:hypothetical protein